MRAGGRAGTQQRLAAGAVRLTATAHADAGKRDAGGGSAVEETRWMAGSCPVLPTRSRTNTGLVSRNVFGDTVALLFVCDNYYLIMV